MHTSKSAAEAGRKKSEEMAQTSVSGIGQNFLSGIDNIATSTGFIIDDLGGSLEDVFQGFTEWVE